MSEPSRRIRWFECKARRAYWSVHLQAWLKSGLSRTRYCTVHRLNRRSFERWLKVFQTPLPPPRRARKKPPKVTYTYLPAARTRARTAFWLMHVEALHGSGLNAAEYAWAHRLPVRRLRKLSRQFRDTPPTQDWRDLMQPVDRPRPASRTALRQELRQVRPAGAVAANPPSAPPRERARRQYTDAQKLAMVAEATEPGVTDSMVARRHGVTPSMLSRWRTEFGFATDAPEEPLLVTARVINPATRGRRKRRVPLVLEHLLPVPPDAVTVELPDGRRVYAPAGSDPDRVRAYVIERESRA